MHRLFIALLPPPELAQALLGAMGGIPGAHWQSAAQLHLTLAFVGAVERSSAAMLEQALESVDAAPLRLMLAEPGLFTTPRGGRAGSLFAHVRGPDTATTARLERLAADVRAACRHAGTPADSRRFLPHITLARTERGGVTMECARPFMERLLPAASWTADRFWLMESRPGSGGACYAPLVDYPFAGAARPS